MSNVADTADTADTADPAGLDPTIKPADPDPGCLRCTAFQSHRAIASGALADILPQLKAAHDRAPEQRLLVFEDSSSRLVEVDLRGPPGDALRALRQASADAGTVRPVATPAPRAAGRPRLGVAGREVTLLPRHWEWLNRQPGGASVALRKLVDEARRSLGGRDRIRQAQEVTYRFLLAMGGDLPGYEEALRALFAGERQRFEGLLASWPGDIREHALRLATEAFPMAA
jgi:hypothetical protein